MLAYIYPVEGDLGGGASSPSHPIAPGGRPVDPGYGQGHPGGVDPGYGHPGGFRPDQSLPWVPGHPSHGLPGSGERPSHPIALPPLPGVYPPPGQPTNPIYIPPTVSNPIVIPGSPEHPIQQPPGTVWPPLPPTTTGKYAILIWVVGVGSRWLVVDAAQASPPIAPTPEPKR